MFLNECQDRLIGCWHLKQVLILDYQVDHWSLATVADCIIQFVFRMGCFETD